MKKTNLRNFLLIAIIFTLIYILTEVLSQNNIDIFFKININNSLHKIIAICIYILLMIPSVIYAAFKVYNLYIKHIRKTNLAKTRYFLVLSSIITSYTFILFNVKEYFYFGNILLLYIIYFSTLYILDIRYVKKQVEKKVIVDNQNVEKFLQLLGGKENIITVSYEHSRLKVELRNIKLVKVQEIKDLGASGIFIAGNKLQAIIGANASELEEALKVYLS